MRPWIQEAPVAPIKYRRECGPMLVRFSDEKLNGDPHDSRSRRFYLWPGEEIARTCKGPDPIHKPILDGPSAYGLNRSLLLWPAEGVTLIGTVGAGAVFGISRRLSATEWYTKNDVWSWSPSCSHRKIPWSSVQFCLFGQ